MVKFMIDTNIYDKISADIDLQNKINVLVTKRRIEILSTHIQSDEIDKIPDHKKKNELRNIITENVATGVFVMGVSRMGQARLGTGNINGVNYNDIVKNNSKHIEDGIIGVTAAMEADILVTNDDKFSRKLKAQNTSLLVYDFDEFKKSIEQMI